MKEPEFHSKGIQFECQGSGNCCVSHGGYGHVFLTKSDRQRLAEHLKMRTSAFTKLHCDQLEGVWKLKDRKEPECIFLKGKRCSVYAARPTQCRTWPFWPEVLNARTWNQEVATFCPGVGKGKVWTAVEVEEQMLAQQASEDFYGS